MKGVPIKFQFQKTSSILEETKKMKTLFDYKNQKKILNVINYKNES